MNKERPNKYDSQEDWERTWARIIDVTDVSLLSKTIVKYVEAAIDRKMMYSAQYLAKELARYQELEDWPEELSTDGVKLASEEEEPNE